MLSHHDDSARQTILVVAPDDLTRRALERALTDHGHTAVTAANAEEAKRVAESCSWELCVVDLPGSPTLEGTELATALREFKSETRALVIHDPHDRWHAPDGESSDVHFLGRPFSMLEFISTVDRALSVGL
ncbi:MAG: hypothetical protein MI757_16105 [Pirellulales bacterium]|nr:hypothetical protein [Pirellulales bacterium]